MEIKYSCAQKKYAIIATCQLNQWAMSFKHNRDNIIKSILMCIEKGVSYRLGPELEICGYSCEDHFFELDTVNHSWQMLADILSDHRNLTNNILCDIGMPVFYKGSLYNCRVFCLNKQILLIRPKLFLAYGNNYRENRWFKQWNIENGYGVEDFDLPDCITQVNKQKLTKIGNAVIKCFDTEIASEICEEIWIPMNPHVEYCLDGVEIISNGSASHHELRKLNNRLNLIQSASARNKCVYMYSNLKGGDGGRLYFDGCSMISMNGLVYAQAEQFSIDNIDVEIAVIDLDQVRALRMCDGSFNNSRGTVTKFFRVCADINISRQIISIQQISQPKEVKIVPPMEEIAFGPALWMWDYLRRSGARGFFLPLSGGADSSAVAALVASMSNLVFKSIQNGNQETLQILRKIVQNEQFNPQNYQEIVNQVFVTCYLGTKNSSEETRNRALILSQGIGSYHKNMDIDEIYDSILNVFQKATDLKPKFVVQGGSYGEDLALQNIQARVRMVVSYLMAQLIPWTKSEKGFLLVLSSSNIAEGLRGYLTKYDCSAADINPIGGINKSDLKQFLLYFSEEVKLQIFADIANAKPSAELRPRDQTNNIEQLDEDEMGMTYSELDEYGKLRQIQRNGPLSMFETLLVKWYQKKDPVTQKPLTPKDIGEKVKKFFRYYSINRHKMTVLTPSYHAEGYGNDDNRFDHRQFLYDVSWEHQFEQIDKIVQQTSFLQ